MPAYNNCNALLQQPTQNLTQMTNNLQGCGGDMSFSTTQFEVGSSKQNVTPDGKHHLRSNKSGIVVKGFTTSSNQKQASAMRSN